MLEHAFGLAKTALVSIPFLAYFDSSKPTRLYADASRLHGLGFVLIQQQSDNSWHLILFVRLIQVFSELFVVLMKAE